MPVVLLSQAAVAREHGDLARAASCCEESLRLARERGPGFSAAGCLLELGRVHEARNELEAARGAFEESLACARAWSDDAGAADALHLLGTLFLTHPGDPARARPLLEESLALHEKMGSRICIARRGGSGSAAGSNVASG